jgi:hypothetical protein
MPDVLDLRNSGISAIALISSELLNDDESILTPYSDPSAATAHPFSRYPIFLTIAPMPHALSLAARVPMSAASFLKNCRSSVVVSTPKKWLNMPMMVSSSSVGSLLRVRR